MKNKLFIIKIFLFCCSLFIVSIAHAVPDVWNVLRSEFALNHDISRPEVQAQIKWLVAHPGFIQTACRQSEPYIYHIAVEIQKKKLPGELALLPIIESAFNPFAYSTVGAAGLWQLMPGTGADFGVKQDWWLDGRRSIHSSTNAALNYLLYLNKFFKGDWLLSIASYDAGEGTISRSMKTSQRTTYWELPVPQETLIYVPRLLALAEIIENPQKYNISLPDIPYLPYFEEVNVGSQIDLNHAAKLAGISYKELIKLNPGFNHWTTAPYKPFKLLLPTDKVQQFNFNLASFPEDRRVGWTKHRVQEGDSLDTIAIQYHTTVNLIKQLNQLHNDNIQPNQSILIPSTKNTPILPKKEWTLVRSKPYAAPTQYTRQIKEVANRRVIHIVQAMDNYQRLEKIYGVTTQDIQYWNKLASNQKLNTGQQLIIWKKIRLPQPYTVQNGDSLGIIAVRHKTTINQIVALNPGLSMDSPLYLGQKILVS